MRAVLDVDVLVSAVLSAQGPPAEILRYHRDGALEMIVSELLVAELGHTMEYPKIQKRIAPEKAAAFIDWVSEHGALTDDPTDPAPVSSLDPDDDYVLALAFKCRAFVVTGDQHLLGLRNDLPILTPAEFVTKLREQS